MPGSKTNQKPTDKSARQLLFSEALHHRRPISTITGPHSPPSPTQSTTISDKEQSITMEKILQEITALSRRIEGMDASLSSLTLETKSMRSDIAGFQTRVTGLEHRMGSLETQMTTYRDRDQDLLYHRSKLHNHARQILQTARKQGPFRIGQHDIRITADYSKDTNERRKAFLALRP
ncbi:hypothetical protein NDU88_000770 [Pleurodeles waltl]|uniref:t-SNARE coiled-coil homology domain-containing protein n=1 Tax=Pleurodeles waltl TaxID=8319 RepID=A0AAV7TFZ3_PLEWA|nr:hypothetical protein NDU88_000770 [Pleurodeles waltl]